MKLRVLLGSVAVVSVLFTFAGAASAADPAAGDRLPLSFTERPLTLPAMIIAPELGFEAYVGKEGGVRIPAIVGTSLGARFGLTDDFEIAADVVPLEFAPDFKYDDPTIGGTYRFLKGDLELGGRLTLRLPTRGRGDRFGFDVGVPAELHIGRQARFDFGGFFTFNSREGTVRVRGFGDYNAVGFSIPLGFYYEIIEPFHVGLSSAIAVTDFKNAGQHVNVPLVLRAGYAIKGDHGPIVDIDPFLGWPDFLTPGNDVDTFNLGFLQLGVEATGYFYL